MKNIYNENKYLISDKLIREFENRKIINNKISEEEKEIYKDVLYLYDIYLNEIALLLKSLHLDNSLDYSLCLHYLIESGYLSISNNFLYGFADFEINSKLGINIVNGVGCCRNYSSFHNDVFNKLKIYNKQFYCYDGSNHVFNSVNKKANHVINLINYEDNLYGIDLANNCRLFHFISPFVMKSISSYSNNKLYYKPYYEIINNESNINGIYDSLKEFDKYSKTKFMSSLIYEEKKYSLINDMDNKRNDFETFSKDTSLLKEKISQKLVRRK